jgi:hypothetical protein
MKPKEIAGEQEIGDLPPTVCQMLAQLTRAADDFCSSWWLRRAVA